MELFMWVQNKIKEHKYIQIDKVKNAYMETSTFNYFMFRGSF